ncbi:MAG TPA: hypothetical protein VLA99_05600 [Nitrospiraceae bacterium]|nr:hypothetical protein [Nitrospiraceae bacterium]
MSISRKREQAKVKLRALHMMAASGVVRPAHVEIRYPPRRRATTPSVEKKERPAESATTRPSTPISPSLLSLAFTLPVTDFIRHLRQRRDVRRENIKTSA